MNDRKITCLFVTDPADRAGAGHPAYPRLPARRAWSEWLGGRDNLHSGWWDG
jgi:hypothetical protein